MSVTKNTELSELCERIEDFRGRAQALVAEITALAEAIPDDNGPQDGRPEAVLASIRAELTEAAGYISNALDFLTPREDDDSPEFCAHRKLQALASKEAS